jgi:hypothetical protein
MVGLIFIAERIDRGFATRIAFPLAVENIIFGQMREMLRMPGYYLMN